MDTTAMNKKRDEFEKRAEELNHEQAIESAKMDVEAKKDALKEAQDVADKAAATDGGSFGIPQKGAEAVRTEALARQAESELDQAQTRLEALKKGDEASLPEPAPPASKQHISKP